VTKACVYALTSTGINAEKLAEFLVE